MTAQKPKFSAAIATPTYQKLIAQTLGDKKKAERYTAAIMSAVATNPKLQQCEAKTILSGSLLAESLGLAHSPQLGQYYLVPFKVKGENGVPQHYDATFVLGYKGYIQLAVRSGQYRHINAMEIKQGELAYYNPFDDEIELNPIQDFDERQKAETVGYYAMFEYLNGFKKVLYWSKKQMLQHADKHSPAFSAQAYEKLQNGEIPQNELWKYSSFWYKDFDGMAKKTMLRQLISKWGVMSTDMVQAMESDNAVMNVSGSEFIPTMPVEEPETPAEPETVDNLVEEVDIDAI
jgi:recombination protein RecT